MKITMDADKLKDLIWTEEKLSNSRVLGGMLLSAQDGVVSIVGLSGNAWAKVSVPATIESDGLVVVAMGSSSGILKGFFGEVTVRTTEKKVIVESGNARVQFNTLDVKPDMFDAQPIAEDAAWYKLPMTLDKTSHAAGKKELFLDSVVFWDEVAVCYDGGAQLSFIKTGIPGGPYAIDRSTLLKIPSDAEVAFTGDKAWFRGDGFLTNTSIYATKPPTALLKIANEDESGVTAMITVTDNNYMEKLGAISAIANSSPHTEYSAKVEFLEDKMVLTTTETQIGSGSFEILGRRTTGADGYIQISPRKMLSAISSIKGEIRIGVDMKMGSPMLLVIGADDGVRSFIASMREQQ